MLKGSVCLLRQDMLQAALELVSKNGYAALNIKAVAAELLGITPKQVMDFAMTMMVYTQGIGTLIASGIVKQLQLQLYLSANKAGISNHQLRFYENIFFYFRFFFILYQIK